MRTDYQTVNQINRNLTVNYLFSLKIKLYLYCMELTNKEIKKINSSLDHGDKKKLAFDVLKIQPSALSRYIRLKRMPSYVYSKILIFISNKEINN